jgi:hypothetical protein
MAVAYTYEIWLSLAIKIMALHATPLEFLPHAQDMHASEIGLLAGHACVLARPLHRGNWRCRMFVVRWMHVWGEVYWPIRDPKKVRPKTALWAVVSSKNDS